MEYGCIGEVLKHSFSKEIHNALATYDYQLKELSFEELSPFMEARNFKAINVTIPYKEEIMPYLYYIDDYSANIKLFNFLFLLNYYFYVNSFCRTKFVSFDIAKEIHSEKSPDWVI